ADALRDASLVLFVVPSHGLRDVLSEAVPLLPPGAPILGAIKGIENDSLKMISQVFEEYVPESAHGRLTYLGGPSFASEVARGMPTVVSIAGRNQDTTLAVQHAL